MESKFNGRHKRKLLCEAYNMPETILDWHNFLRAMYNGGMSAVEIEEKILRDTGITYTARSIQRIVGKYGEIREQKESFRNAMKRGRVVWQVELDAERRKDAKKQISRKLRFEIMERDGWKCVLCGGKELLQIDHIIARVNGGEDTKENLRTLCIDCNIGKQQAKKEYGPGTMRSGQSA